MCIRDSLWCKAVALLCGARGYMCPVGDVCLAAVTKRLAGDAVARGVKESKARFGDWIDAQAVVRGAALHSFTKEVTVNASATSK
eukprot:4876541-Pyramimonas_sp.AAC.1